LVGNSEQVAIVKFTDARVVEDLVYNMKLSNWDRGRERARINQLFDGDPPFRADLAKENNIVTNVNFLEPTQLAQDGRRQFYNAMMKPGNYFTVSLDSGPTHKRSEWSRIITREINKRMKRKLPYMESLRSRFANVVLHGIGPVAWEDKELWCPEPLGIDDVLVPGNTLVSLKNLSFFAIFRQYTVEQLHRMTTGPRVDPGWNIQVVNKAIKWASDQGMQSFPNHDWYSPEKLQERLKSDSGLFGSDMIPTIDCYDFYFYSDDDKESGWNRRIVLDGEWGGSVSSGLDDSKPAAPSRTKVGTRGKFLYDSGKRKYAEKLEQIIHFQFGDLSAVAPFRYYSVRSLGFMLFAICHLQNRLRCRFSDAVFENLMQYFRVHNIEDAERAMKINLVDKGIIDNSVEFIKQADRWQVNGNLIQSALAHNREIMGANSAGFTHDYDFGKEQTEKTATQVTAESQASTALVGAMLSQAYAYQVFEYREDARRFCRKNSKDSDVRKFRLECLKAGVPEDYIDVERWEIEPERVLGAGNKMLELNIADRMMAARNLFDPEPQRRILREWTLAITDNPGLTDALVPEQPVAITDSVVYAQSLVGTLMKGLPVKIKTGINHIEAVDTFLEYMEMIIQGIEQSGGMTTQENITGLGRMAEHVAEHIQIIAQDQQEKQRVKKYGDALSKMMNMVRAYQQRLEEQMQEQNGHGQGPDPEVLAKMEAQKLLAESKVQNARESHAEKTAQRRISFEEKKQQSAEQHKLDLQKKEIEAEIELATKQGLADVETQKAVIKAAQA
jgi:hypothetical protein